MRLPLWAVVGVDIGMGLTEGGFTCLQRWVTHHPIRWIDAGIGSFIAFVTFLCVHLWCRSVLLRRERENETPPVAK